MNTITGTSMAFQVLDPKPQCSFFNGDIVFFDDSVKIAGVCVELSQLQRSFLHVLLRHAGHPCPRSFLLRRAGSMGKELSMNTFTLRLRRILDPTPYQIETVRGEGYRITKKK